MIATILKPSSTFAGVGYNSQKVNSGSAELVEAYNFGYLSILENKTSADYVRYLKQWSQKNARIKNSQFHAAISCKGNSYAKEELVQIAKQWLKKMGYENIPTMLYFHTDTLNNHLHIVTSRVAPDGSKVNDSNEKYRARAAIVGIMKNDLRFQANESLEKALCYNFSNIRQFEAIIDVMGFSLKVQEPNFCIEKENKVLLTDSLSLIQDKISENANLSIDEKRKKQLMAIFYKYKESMSLNSFLKLVKSSFGIELLFLGDKNNPYGYMVIDHSKQCVYKGSEILSLKKLLTDDGGKKEIELMNTVMASFEGNPYVTTEEINQALKLVGAHLKNDSVIYKKTRVAVFTLAKELIQQLKYNDNLKDAKQFYPVNKDQVNVLANFFNINPEHLNVKNNLSDYGEIYKENLLSAFESHSLDKINVFVSKDDKGSPYFIDVDNKLIVPFSELGIGQYMSFNQSGETEREILEPILDIILTENGSLQYEGGGGVDNSLPKKKKK